MISKTHRATTYARDGYRCLKCGTAAYLTIDHIIPLSKGGKNTINNYQTLCKNCNVAKGSRTIDYRKDGESLIEHLKDHENILVFSKGSPVYNPQFSAGTPYTSEAGRASANWGAQKENVITENSGFRYPKSVLEFNRERGFHPTQKPIPLLEYLIKTYTPEPDKILDSSGLLFAPIILDNCSGSGSTAIAALNTKRHFICIEKEEKYVNLSRDRILKHLYPELN